MSPWKGGRKESQKRWNSKESSKKLKRQYYLLHKSEHSNANKKLRSNRKVEVLSHYSSSDIPVCAHCFITDIDVLTIDHINGGGNKHKIITGGAGDKLYRWLKVNNFPVGYQVLCFNCNFKKGLYDKRRKQDETQGT